MAHFRNLWLFNKQGEEESSVEEFFSSLEKDKYQRQIKGMIEGWLSPADSPVLAHLD